MVDTKVVQTPARYGSSIKADKSTGELPSTIEVLRAGTWPETSNKGMLFITPDDLQQYVSNFKAGIGVPGGADFGQIPIDFGHDDGGEAAGWITDLFVQNNILFATVTWTDAGKAALLGGMFKCFSPSFWPSCLGEYYDSEDWNATATNVLVGGGLTNIPFFKDLTAIMASNAGNSRDSKLNSNARKENIVPTLDEVRIKDVANLSEEDKKVLADNKAELSADELKKFDMVESDAAVVTADNSAVTGISDEDKAILASVKAGTMKVVKADEWDGMKEAVTKLTADNQKHEEAEITAFVTAQAKDGKIKADQVSQWVGYIKANADMKTALEALPVHAAVTPEKGSSKDGDVKATAELEDKIKEAMTADSTLTYAQAVVKVAKANSQLANQHDEQLKN